MIKIRQIEVEIDKDNKEYLYSIVAKKLNVKKEEIIDLKISKKSIDARRKPLIKFIYEVIVTLTNEDNIKYSTDIIKYNEDNFIFNITGTKNLLHRPVVVGSGPAGLFCAYILAENGYKPIIIERGKNIQDRVKDVEEFWNTGNLNENYNVQFGLGGAGTFSDGKLNTLVKKSQEQNKIFEIFVNCGANENILYDSKPHIGTDILRTVVTNIHDRIIDMGGEFLFNTCLTDLIINDNTIEAIEVNNKDIINTDVLILAIGHSARDTFKMLNNYLDMEQKPFAVGIRIQHKQSMINKSQYGVENHPKLSAAPYKLTHQAKNGKGVYTFCMCPGGLVVNASSVKNRLAINGMSNNKRDEENANSAVVVTVNSKDYGTNLFDGMNFQRELEEKTYLLGNGKIPVSLYKDYKENKVSNSFKSVNPVFKGSTTFANINDIFPKSINEALIEGIEAFSKKINGYNNDDAIIAAVESRTSSPIRILRNETLNSNVNGIYPCGEGAGYAGGITTSAIDGIKVAESIASIYKPGDSNE